MSFREFLEELRATYRAVTDGRRGRLLRELGSRVVEQEAVPEPMMRQFSALNEFADEAFVRC